MGNARIYPNAPIAEAIIQLLVQPAGGASFADLARCHEGEENAYLVKSEFAGQPGQSLAIRAVGDLFPQHRFIYASADEKQVYQVRLDGFSFSRLAPYQSWEPFCKEARRLWQKYRECLKPLVVTRLSVRFVNRLDIPGDRIEIKDYLRVTPEIAEGLPQALEGYFMQVQIPMEDGLKLLVNETIAESPKPGCVSLIFDIDLSRTEDIPKDEAGLWFLFDSLRVRKNEIFEACITDRARELFR